MRGGPTIDGNQILTGQWHSLVMDRRFLIAGSALAMVFAGLAPVALASESSSAEPAVYEMTMIGFPVIRDGRLLNYVFVNMKLHLAKGTRPEAIQAKEAQLRDVLVRTGHRTPFILPDNNRELNTRALTASVMAHAATLYGRGIVTRVEVMRQMSRNR